MKLQVLWSIRDTFTQRMSVLFRVLTSNSRDFITRIYCIHKGDSQLNFKFQEIGFHVVEERENKLLVEEKELDRAGEIMAAYQRG